MKSFYASRTTQALTVLVCCFSLVISGFICWQFLEDIFSQVSENINQAYPQLKAKILAGH